MKRFIYVPAILLILACGCSKTKKQNEDDGIVREYHSNGKIKTEIAVAGNLRHGLTRNYNNNGQLISQVRYVNNVKEDTATNFYAASGKVNSTLVFKHGIKEGDETWYYESGQKYRVSPYINGRIQGIQKYYYESGQLKAEIPYKDGFAGTGLKEYEKDGTPVKKYPELIIRRVDHMRDANKMVLEISMSKDARDIKFYRGPLMDGKYLHKKLFLLATQEGTTQLSYTIPPGENLDEKVIITANCKTRMGSTYIVSKAYNLKAFNPN